PFDAGMARLNGALTDAGSPLPDARSDPAESVSVWLPTVDGVPGPSSPLIARAPAGAPAAPGARQVTVLPLPPAAPRPLPRGRAAPGAASWGGDFAPEDQLVSAMQDGKALPEDKVKQTTIVIKDDTFRFPDLAEAATSREGTFKLDATKKPKHMDTISTTKV